MKRGVSRKYNESSQDMHYQVIPEGIKLSPRILFPGKTNLLL